MHCTFQFVCRRPAITFHLSDSSTRMLRRERAKWKDAKKRQSGGSCDAGAKWWPKNNMASVMRLGEQSRSEQVTNEPNRSAWHVIQRRVWVCVSLRMCEADGVWEWKSVCEADKQRQPKGLVTWWSEPVTFLKHTLWYLHIHTKANNPNSDGVIHVKGSMKEGVRWPLYSPWDAPE